MSVTAVIVNYHTASFLPTLINQLQADLSVIQTIVVDNSKEFSESAPLGSPTHLKIIKNDENRGFGPAVNMAVEHAVGDWILVVNPDVRLVDGCLDHLLRAARHYATPLVGPRFYWDDQLLFRLPPATGMCLWLDFANMSAGKHELDAEIFSFYWTLRHERFWEAKAPFYEPFLSGACVLVERQWAGSIGGHLFDDRFFLYFEDTDLCVRAIRDNVRPLCVPQARAVHYFDQAPPPDKTKAELMARAHTQFLKKYYGNLSLPILDSPSLCLDVTDLGEIADPPTFDKGNHGAGQDSFFEIAVNQHFVPFAQAPLKDNMFEFPADVWNRLAPGVYYGRFRSSVSGVGRVCRWKKQ